MWGSDRLWNKLHAFHIFPHVENFQGLGMTSQPAFPLGSVAMRVLWKAQWEERLT